MSSWTTSLPQTGLSLLVRCALQVCTGKRKITDCGRIGINSNYGDTATLTNIVANSVDDICVTYTGTDDNDEEPEENRSGPDGTYCIYSDSDVTTS